MRFAYADPPYPGQSRRIYGDHPDYDGEVDHAELIARLEEEFPDGWALSTSSQALPEILALCPRPEPGIKGRRYLAGTGVRVLSWKKLNPPPYPVRVQYSWEPVILRRGRGYDGGPRTVLDSMVCAPHGHTFKHKPEGHVRGAKPPEFCRWVFECLGARPGDELVDVFPGSGMVGREWDAFTRQTVLL